MLQILMLMLIVKRSVTICSNGCNSRESQNRSCKNAAVGAGKITTASLHENAGGAAEDKCALQTEEGGARSIPFLQWDIAGGRGSGEKIKKTIACSRRKGSQNRKFAATSRRQD